MSYRIIPTPQFQKDVKYLYFLSQNENTIYLLTIYAKAYKENISITEIKEIISRYGL